FNQGRYIEQTICSVLDQGYPNLEYIIIDGGSTDNTLEIVRKYEKQLAWCVSEPDRGQAHAINKGLEKSTGEIFNWLNSDDYLEKNALFKIGEYFNDHPEKQVLCGRTRVFYNESGKTSHVYRMGLEKNVAKTILNVEMNQPGTFYRMSIIKKLGGVNETLRYVFDDELWFKYLCDYGQKNIAFTNRLLAQFRLHGNSKSVNEGYGNFNKEIVSIWLEMAKLLRLPDYIIERISREERFDYYKTKTWGFDNLDRNFFLAHFCRKYQYIFYREFKYKEAE
ncbi:MAG: glycosyltransferase family 2 protein, partial [Candidatus Omnitrophica bacterium]|nr:glycosyltransferase family 2 protein [Candidatus Omnitrophota bacterium]